MDTECLVATVLVVTGCLSSRMDGGEPRRTNVWWRASRGDADMHGYVCVHAPRQGVATQTWMGAAQTDQPCPVGEQMAMARRHSDHTSDHWRATRRPHAVTALRVAARTHAGHRVRGRQAARTSSMAQAAMDYLV